jgi:hypothetical protein
MAVPAGVVDDDVAQEVGEHLPQLRLVAAHDRVVLDVQARSPRPAWLHAAAPKPAQPARPHVRPAAPPSAAVGPKAPTGEGDASARVAGI